MRPVVRDEFLSFSVQFEGCVPWLYLDIKGLVTCGIGNLVDPLELALRLPFVRPGGYAATQDEIAAAWHKVKAYTALAEWGATAAEHVTDLRLTDDGIRTLVTSKADEMWAHLAQRFVHIEEWPADAQLGVLSMAWAAGAAFNAPNFSAACRNLDFATAAKECRFQDALNPGLRPRNDANQLLFRNADHVMRIEMDRDVLHYPATVIDLTNIVAGETIPPSA